MRGLLRPWAGLAAGCCTGSCCAGDACAVPDPPTLSASPANEWRGWDLGLADGAAVSQVDPTAGSAVLYGGGSITAALPTAADPTYSATGWPDGCGCVDLGTVSKGEQRLMATGSGIIPAGSTAVALTQPYTVAALVYPDLWTEDEALDFRAWVGDVLGSTALVGDALTDGAYVEAGDGGAGGGLAIGGGGVPHVGLPVLIVAVYNGASSALYVNGELVAEGDLTGTDLDGMGGLWSGLWRWWAAYDAALTAGDVALLQAWAVEQGAAAQPILREQPPASASKGAGGTTLAAAMPSLVEDGDLLIALVNLRAGGGTVTPPSGWTQIDSDDQAGNVHGAVFTRTASSEPVSYTWTFSTTDQAEVTYLVVTGWSAVDSIGSDSDSGTATLRFPAAAAGTAPRRMVLRLLVQRNAVAISADPAGSLLIADDGVLPAQSLWLEHADAGAVAATTATAALTTMAWVSFTMVVS